MKNRVCYHVAVLFCLGLLACQSDDEKFEEASKEVVFRVVNYTQYNLDEVTRASADVLDHLVLGVFDAESNAMVGSLITQDKGADGYGTFKVKLPVGQYRLVFLGYVGSSTFNMSSPTLVTFANDAVPTTFSYSTTLTVGHDQIEAQNIVLKRAFGAFRVTLTDVIPSGVATMRFRSVGGSTKLNGQTGYAADNSGRTFSVSIPTSYIGKEDVKLTLNLFLPGQVPVPNFVLVGMAGLMAGVMQAPLTAIFLIAEISGGYELLMPLILTSAIAYGTTRIFEKYSIYTKRIAQTGELLTHDSDQAVLTLLKTESLVETDFTPVHIDDNLGALVEAVAVSKRNVFPVVDGKKRFQGYVDLSDIRRDMFRTDLYEVAKVYNYMRSAPEYVYPDEPMDSVMRKFGKTGAWNLPVVDRDRKYIGFLSRSKIFNAYREELRDFSQD